MLKGRPSRRSAYYRRSAMLALLGVAISVQSVNSADLIVSSAADLGPGTLRDALTSAQPGDRILFNFGGPTTITVASDLPSIRDDLSFDSVNGIPVTIDGGGVTGAIDIAGGTVDPVNLNLANFADDPNIVVDPSATIIGDGTVTGNFQLPGTLSPGRLAGTAGIGTFDVAGDLDLTDGVLQTDLSTAGGVPDSDLVTVSNTATLSDARLDFRFSGNQFQTGQQFLILDAGDPVTTAFVNQNDRFAIPDRPFLELVFDPTRPNDQIGYVVQDNGTPFSSAVTGCNQLSAAEILEDLRGGGNAGVDALVNSSAATLQAAANAISGSIYPSLLRAELVHIQNNLESVRDRVLLQRYACVDPPAVMPWVRAYGVAASVNDDDCGTLGYYQEFGGMEAGLAVSNQQGLSSHVFAHLGGGELEMTGIDQNADIESYRGGGSVEYVGERFYALAAGGAGVQNYDVYRSLAAIDGATSAQSSFDGTAQFGYFETGTVFCWHAIDWMPYVGLHTTRVDFDPVNETGDPDFALSNPGGSSDSLRGVLGLGLQKSGGTPLGLATTRIRFGWMHEYDDPNAIATSRVANPSIDVLLTDLGVDPGTDWGFLRVQLDWFRLLGGQTSISYQGQANSRSSFNALAGGIQWVW